MSRTQTSEVTEMEKQVP